MKNTPSVTAPEPHSGESSDQKDKAATLKTAHTGAATPIPKALHRRKPPALNIIEKNLLTEMPQSLRHTRQTSIPASRLPMVPARIDDSGGEMFAEPGDV